jgi:hypothetical protein
MVSRFALKLVDGRMRQVDRTLYVHGLGVRRWPSSIYRFCPISKHIHLRACVTDPISCEFLCFFPRQGTNSVNNTAEHSLQLGAWISWPEESNNYAINLRKLSIVTGYGLDGRGSIPDRRRRFSSTPLRPDRLCSPLRFLSNGYWWLFPEGRMRPGREVHKSSPSTVEVKNVGAMPAGPHTSSWY